jgi:hypothetical protein
MQWLKRVVPKLLVVAAFAVTIVVLVTDHRAEYGTVALPQGGLVQLPEGTVKVFVDEPQQPGDPRDLSSPLSFDVTPVGSSAALAKNPEVQENSRQLTKRSEAIGSKGAVASIDAPSSGAYRVSGGFAEATPGASLSFGTDGFMAVIDRWKILAGLLLGAFLLTLIPVPSRGSSYEASAGEAGGGSEPGSYQPPRFNPYNG